MYKKRASKVLARAEAHKFNTCMFNVILILLTCTEPV